MTDFTIKSGSYCPVCRGIVLQDCPHTMQQLGESNYSRDVIAERDRLQREVQRLRALATKETDQHG